MGRALSRLNALVQSAASWLAVGGAAMSVAWTLLARGADLFGGLTWPQAIMLGVLLALATMLVFATVLALGAYAFRRIKPLPVVTETPRPPALDYDPNGIGERLSEVERTLAGLDELTQATAQTRAEQSEFQAKMETWVGQLRDDVERRFEWVDQGIAAILDRERLMELATAIETVGDELSGPTRGESPDEWDAWLAKYGGWKRNVEVWSRVGAIYRDGVIERVHDTPPSEYRGKWEATDDLFPNSLAVHDYKTFRIMLRNFYVEREPVHNCVRMAAFARPSLKGRGSTSRDEQQMPRPPKV